MDRVDPARPQAVLASFGVPAEAESLWRALVVTPKAGRDELAVSSSLDADAFDLNADLLIEAGLVRRGASTSGLIAIDPSLAVERHIVRAERQLAERAEELASLRALMPEIAIEYARGRADSGDQPAFEIIVPLEDIRRQIQIVADQESTEVRALVDVALVEAVESSEPASIALLERGVKSRTILPARGLDHPNVYVSYEALSRRGELFRTLPEVPTQLLIFGRSLAVLGVDAKDSSLGAMFIRAPSLVSVLIYMFDRMWAEADPVFTTSSDALAPVGRQVRVLELLAIGSTDDRIARSLGIGVRTVRREIAEIKALLGVSSRTEIAAAAVRKGWL